jgi:hypothetical protein
MWSRKRLIVTAAVALAVFIIGAGVFSYVVAGLRLQVTASRTSASSRPTASSSPSAVSTPTAFSSPTATSTPIGFGRSTPGACPSTSVLVASQANPNDPSPRNSAALAYDGVRKQLVLFGGGAGDTGTLGDTWVWNGTSWRQQHPVSSPPARAFAQMTFDAAHGVVLLFGGGPSVPLDDTWTWDGNNWTQQHPALRPPGTAGSAMDYDAALGQVVLVVQPMGGPAQTWAWDGATWHQILTAQSPRNQSTAMASDPVAKQLVLFDHFDQATWTFDAAAGWSRATALGPSQASLPTMAYDAATRSMVLFVDGGQGATWTWDGKAWTQRCPAATPPGLSSTGPHAAMAYDADAGVMVVFGGAGATSMTSNATWIWDGTTWAQWHARP